MASVGGAAAAGLESGLGLGLRMQALQQQDADRQRRQQLEDEDRATARTQRETQRQQQEQDRQLQALQSQLEALRAEGEGYASQYGGQVPQEISAPYQQRVQELTGARDQLLRSRYEPVVKARQQQMTDVLSRLQTDPNAVQTIADGDLYSALETALRRDPRDMLSTDGQPSRVDVAVQDVMNGLQTSNQAMALRGANVLLEPELRVGIGQPSAHGGVIVGKRVEALVPHPQKPGEFTPMLRVYVGDGKIDTKDEEARAAQIRAQDPDAPPNATGYYLAPVTQHRSTDPNDPVQSISVEKAMGYAARLQTLSKLLSDHPELRTKVERGAASAPQAGSFLTAYASLGGKMPAKQVEWKAVKPGERLVGLDPRGDQVGTIEGPPKAAPTTGLGGQVASIQAYADENDMTFEEAASLFQRRGLLRAPKGGAGAGGAGGGGLPSMPKAGATGEQVLAGLSEDDATVVQGLADGSIRPSEISTKGNRRERMLALAKRFDPSADFGPNGRLKEVPATAQKAMLENDQSLRRAERALRLVGGAPAQEGETADPNATGLKGYVPNQLLNRLDPSGVEARAAIADLGSLIIHDRSGAAVTAAEFPRLAPFIPSEKDDADTVKKKLRGFQRVYKEEQDALRAAYSKDNGYKDFKTGTSAAPAPAPAPAPGGMPSTNAKGWRLMTDAKGNRAYVSPDGKSFEEVR